MPAFSKDFSENELLNFPLEDLMKVKISSSTLTEKNIRTVPSSITIFTRPQIQAMGIDSLEELLNFVPGFQSFRQADAANEYYHSVRGRRTGTASREVLVLIDGQRFNQDYSAAEGTPIIALENIEKIEIIRGPGSAIYGSNAFTGIINIITVRDKNAIKLRAGSYGQTQATALYSGHYNDINVDFYANFFRDDGELYHLEQPLTHLHYAARDPFAGYDFNANVRAGNTQLNIIHSTQWANEFYVVERFSNQYDEKREEYSSVQLQHTLESNSSVDTHFRLRYYQWSGFLQFPVNDLKTDTDFKEQALEFNINNNWKINQSQSLQFGAEQWHIHNERAELMWVLPSVLLSNAATRNISGVYLQHQSTFAEGTELTLGARYDDYTAMTSALSPRFALTHQLSQVQTIKLLYGQAFRAPGFGELILNATDVGVGNPALKPETIETLELVWMGNWQNKSLTITGFNSQVKDSIIQGFIGTERQYMNAEGLEHSQGIEIESMLQFTSQWQLSAQYSLFNKLPESAFRQADNLASFILNYQNNHWNFNIAANYAGAREMLAGDAKLRLDRYWLMNSKLQYLFGDEQKIYFQAKNLANKIYFTPAQGIDFSAGIPNRGRELSVGIEWNF